MRPMGDAQMVDNCTTGTFVCPDCGEPPCDRCGNTCDEVGCEAGPEWDECCEQVLCERCWFASHVYELEFQ